jgi:sugar lactone lactonase YvrE
MPKGAPHAFVAALLLSFLAPQGASSQPVFVTSWNSVGIPLGLLLDGAGHIYSTCEQGGGAAVRKFDLSGNLLAVLGADDPYEGYGAVRLSDGSVEVADYYNLRVQRFTDSGALLSSWPTGGVRASYMTADASDDVYIADDEGDRVRKFSAQGVHLSDWASPHPTGIAYGGGVLYVAARNAGLLTRYGPDGANLGSFSTGIQAAEQVALDAFGNLYITDAGAYLLRKFTPSGITVWTLGSSVPGYSFGPVRYDAVAIANDGTLYVGDYDHRRILVLTEQPTGVATSSWGQLKARYR